MGAVFLSGTYAQCLAAGIKLGTRATIWSGNVDPSAVATTGAAGDVYLSTSTLGMYIKSDAGSSTNWVKIEAVTLASGHIFVGNAGGIATDVAMSGDISISNTGATTVAKIQSTTVSGTTGSGNVVFSTSPSLTTPALGTPSAGVLTSCTGLPISSGVSGLGTGVATFLGTPSSANLASAITDETGSGALVFATSPTLVTPVLGVATATSVNKMAITAPATSSTLAVADGKTLTASNTLTFTGTDASSVAFGTGGTVAYTANNLSVFASTTSAQLAGVLSDETGSGAAVFANTPTLVTPVLGTPNSGTLTNCTGLPVSSGISGLAAGVATFLATPSSANLATACTDETGTGALVFANTPTLVTPVLGTPNSGTLTNCTGLPVSSGISGLAAGVATFLATPSSANLATACTDETGSGALVFATSPTLVTPLLGTPTSGTLTNCTGLPLTSGITGTLGVANGGTGSTIDIAPTSFSAANNQGAAANVTGLAFANGTVRAFEALVSVYVNATSSLYETVKLIGIQRGADWQMASTAVGDASQFVFSITTAGQVQYTSGNYSGFTAATLKFRAICTPV